MESPEVLFSGDVIRKPALVTALDQLGAQGRVLICGAVYAELCGFHPHLDTLLQQYGVSIDPNMPLETWKRAGVAYAAYGKRRRASLPRRILTDFLVGAHASGGHHSLFTLNTGDYGDFPEVPLLTVR
ncbi:type II toxin-antitoxin system VapC family toxin [Deinococcus marmoris]|uniref:PIN domain-containing protein n=1 Tax=Deinococcus marmoris TaxID=249408 RepID=A0A1U7NWZ5_9DEIO|nr:hypothetical protein [Deinococcus marmoris]OLV17441.1 hypothetical protein BOO71_0008821 [Deinococcus marmoris]